MTWNNRVFRNIHENGEIYYTVNEVYYNKDGSIMGYIEEGKAPWGTDVDELRWVIQMMLESCDDEIIDRAELEAHFENLRLNEPQVPEEPYEVYDSVEDLLAALEEDTDADSESGDTGQ